MLPTRGAKGNKMDGILAFLKSIIESHGGDFSVVSKILMIIGVIRVMLKPIMSVIQAFISLELSPGADSFLQKVLDSPIYKSISYILDWSASIKLPQLPKDSGAVK